MWVSQIPEDPIVASWWRESERRARREAAVGDARRRGRTRRRVRAVDQKLAAVEAAAELRSARELLPPAKRASFDRGLTASARDAGLKIEHRGGGEVEWHRGTGGEWWRLGPEGVEVIPHVPDRPW
jgi:hypothetical protein